MASPQTLTEAERRLLATWAAACARRVLPLVAAPDEALAVILDALARAEAFGAGESTPAAEIRRRLDAAKVASAATTPAGSAAARSIGQAAAVAHMGAHALGAAGYAVKAVSLAPDGEGTVAAEIVWQLAALRPEQRAALAQLPPVGEGIAGPLAPGLLSRGVVGGAIRDLQSQIGTTPEAR